MDRFMKIIWDVIVGLSLVGQPSYISGLGNLATSKAVWHRPPAELSALRTTGLTITLFQFSYFIKERPFAY